MSTLAVKFDDHAIDVAFTAISLQFILADGREISAPLEWFPRLRDANGADRNNWRIIGNGIGVHWPEIDEDIAVATLMRRRQLASWAFMKRPWMAGLNAMDVLTKVPI